MAGALESPLPKAKSTKDKHDPGDPVLQDTAGEELLDRLRVSVASQRDGRFGLGLSVKF